MRLFEGDRDLEIIFSSAWLLKMEGCAGEAAFRGREQGCNWISPLVGIARASIGRLGGI